MSSKRCVPSPIGRGDDTDIGYYVFKPGYGTSGSANERGTIGTGDDKTKALLFFPAAGVGYLSSLNDAGGNGRYWSSVLGSVNSDYAFSLFFNPSKVNPEANFCRYYGHSVRPVSD